MSIATQLADDRSFKSSEKGQTLKTTVKKILFF